MSHPTSEYPHPTIHRCWSRPAPPDPYLLHYRDVLNSGPETSPVPTGLTERRTESAVKRKSYLRKRGWEGGSLGSK